MTAARRFLEEGVAVARNAGDKAVLSEGLRELGSVYYLQGNLMAAVSIAEESLGEARAVESIGQVVLALLQLVVISCSQKDQARAKGYCFELWAIGRETGSLFVAGLALIAFGLAESFIGEPGRGVRLLAATDMLLRQRGPNLIGGEDNPFAMLFKQALEKAQAQLGPAAFATAWAEGQQMTAEQALALATENEDEDSPLPKDGLGRNPNA